MKLEEPCEGRLSSTVPWERKGETPFRVLIGQHNDIENVYRINKTDYMKRLLNHCLLFSILFSISCEKNSDKEIILPEVSSKGFSSITLNRVLCEGVIKIEGSSPILHRGFCWNTTMNPTLIDSTIYVGNGSGNFSSVISGLSPNTTYYVRAFAINSADTVYSSGMSIKTYTRLISDIDGNEYYTVTIGSQEWMAENLKASNFRNGEPITNLTADSLWDDEYVYSAMCYYNNDSSINHI